MHLIVTKVGENLAKDLTPIAATDISYISRVTPTIAQMSSVKARLEKEIQRVKTGKATGADKITAKKIKAPGRAFTEDFLSGCNTSLEQNKFPTKYKIAQLKMSLKSGPPSDLGNYRPLSMLSSKLLEGVVCSEIDDHVEKVPNPNQWDQDKSFSIYVGDLPNCLSVGQIHMYADDTTSFCIGNSIEEEVVDNNAASQLRDSLAKREDKDMNLEEELSSRSLYSEQISEKYDSI
eukprot:gene12126-2729_t